MPNALVGDKPNQVPPNHALGRLARMNPEDLQLGILHVRDEKAASAAGGSSAAADWTQTRVLNTVVTNTMAGASLSSNQITVLPGTYDFEITAPASGSNAHQAALYNVTDSTYARIGTVEYAGSGAQTSSIVKGRIVLTAAKTFSVRHYTATATASSGLGLGVTNNGQPTVFTEVIFRKVL